MKFSNHERARTETQYTYWVDPAEANNDDVVSKLQRRKIKDMLRFRAGDLVYLVSHYSGYDGKFRGAYVHRFKQAKRPGRNSRFRSAGDKDRVGDGFETAAWTPAIFLAIVRIPGESWWACIQVGSERLLLRGNDIIAVDEVQKTIERSKERGRNSRWH